jgi:hypothetical protein
MISGTVTSTLTFDPAVDFEHPKDQTAKTSKMTFELSIAKVKKNSIEEEHLTRN